MKRTVILFLTCLVFACCYGLALAGESGDTNSESGQSKEATVEDNKEKKDNKYELLFEDETFFYLLDQENSGWVRQPYTADKYMIDVWVKLKPYEYSSNKDAAMLSESSTFYLEHYVMDPPNKRIQFLCELEVTGRPDNKITQRKYDPARWEPLVPESLEDRIFHAVVNKYGTKKGNGKIGQIGEFLEDVFRIAL